MVSAKFPGMFATPNATATELNPGAPTSAMSAVPLPSKSPTSFRFSGFAAMV